MHVHGAGGGRHGPQAEAEAACEEGPAPPCTHPRLRCGAGLQIEGSPYSGVLDAARRIVAAEGVGALYRSYRTTLVMNIPFTAMHFSVYETAKKLIHGGEEEDAAGSLVPCAAPAAADNAAQLPQVLEGMS